MIQTFKILIVISLVSCGTSRSLNQRFSAKTQRGSETSEGAQNHTSDGLEQGYNPQYSNQISQAPAQSTPTASNTRPRGETIIIGDSIFAFPIGKKIGAFLNEKTSTKIPDYSESGAVMNPANVDHVKSMPALVQAILNKRKLIIPNQYMNFVRPQHRNIDTIVMDGGGNDIFRNESTCIRMGCETVYQGVESTLQQLFNKMKSDGVQNIVYLGYYDLKGAKANLNGVVNQGNQRLRAACERSPVRCVFIDTRNLISPGQIILDGIHPSAQGSEVLASAIYNVLRQI